MEPGRIARLPVAGYFVGAELGGRDAGMLAATVVVWLTVIGRKVITRSVPRPAHDLCPGAHPADRRGDRHRQHALLPAPFPLANLGLCVLFARTAPTRKPLVAQLAADSRRAAPAVGPITPGPAPVLSRARRGCGPAFFLRHHGGPGRADDHRDGQGVPAAHHGRDDRRHGRRHVPFPALWFVRVLRRFGLRVRFAQP